MLHLGATLGKLACPNFLLQGREVQEPRLHGQVLQKIEHGAVKAPVTVQEQHRQRPTGFPGRSPNAVR
eukprot:CAMPEP_0175823744 /NCGR_PEP_ID=MMETSP0107_2-20121207/10365_1 /TAXON_ID=195067 ORGANISM="Goniomonas pacifica, Strain CCMP1869" /NCGR_SAMPLE_ID=MMETSP0107_2 /ASSEMBLY_ACC=CAM_ASM_000203 /LENGTH=67 /DNA_ID=CAMNT_0017136277 /DNA_START=230 /DNA_END=433 /DNA_ORIENTATION=-